MRRVALGLMALFVLSGVAEAAKKPKPPAPPAEMTPPPPPPDPEAWRKTPPKPGDSLPWKAPEPQVLTLSNGISVYYLQSGSLPLVSVRLQMNLGRETNPVGKAGLGYLTADLLDEGTKSKDATAIAIAAQSLGAELGVNANEEGVMVSLDALTGEALGPSLDLMADVVLHPAFSKSDFGRVQAELLSDLQAENSNPRALLRRALLNQMYGPEHPYGVPVNGSEASIQGMKIKDVKNFYKTWWHAGNASLVVVGGVEKDAILSALEARFGSWKAQESERPPVQPAAALLKTRVVFVEQAGSVQSMIAVATPGIGRNSPDWHAATVAGTLVAGMFSSPLNMVLREEKGWSYGAYGGFTESRDGGLFTARTSVQADKTAPALSEILKVLSTAAAAPPTDEMLAMTKDYLRKSLPGNFDTNANAAASLASLPTYELRNDAWSSYDHDIDVISSARSYSMASRWFRPERQLIVVVGPRTVQGVDVVAELKALGYEFVDASAQ